MIITIFGFMKIVIFMYESRWFKLLSFYVISPKLTLIVWAPRAFNHVKRGGMPPTDMPKRSPPEK